MELRNLKTFHVVSSCLNFTKAAQILNYSQPTISQQIKALEEELGHTLINRVGKKMFLSQVGKLLKEHTDKLFNVIDEMEQDLKKFEKPFGHLTISAPEFYCGYYLSHILGPFIKLYPQVNLKLICANSKETIALVSSNKADIGFIAGKQSQSGIQEILLDEEDLVLVGNPLILKNRTIQEVFDEYPFITYGMDGIIQGCLQEIQCTPKTIVEFESEEAIKRAVMGQVGVALLSDLIIKKEVNKGTLQVLYRFPRRLPTYLIYPQNLKEFSNVSTLIDLVTDMWRTI
ncbi:LysR family transcriptional regulator [Peribacillus butanolivorans]|uniref:LysR family transcriptional regulator n=1 Tax=Peribacillus butanolivorans TaxID=421767 RepID=UPI00070A6F09|nr:LysR family transcriptional regulator [Bacillus sp. Soil768D1]